MNLSLRLVAICIASMVLFSCQNKKMTVSNTKTLKYLALGDSYTIGESVADAERFPMQLAAMLSANKINVATPEIIARTGWTTNELQAAINEAKPTSDYDLVTLLIGVNNQYRGYPMAQYLTEFEALLKQAIIFGKGATENIIVVTIPDYGVTPFAEGRDRAKIGKEVLDYNNEATAIAKRYNIRVVDIYAISQKAKENNELVASDGLHPSALMYKAWTAEIYPQAVAILRK